MLSAALAEEEVVFLVSTVFIAAGIPTGLAGTWNGTGIPENGGPSISLTITIRDDGTGEYAFEQNGYTESNPISISAQGNTFTVTSAETSQFSKAEGNWSLTDGVLTLSITSTLPSGRAYFYTAECTKAEEASPETADSAETGGKIYTWVDFSFKLAELTFGLGDFESTLPDYFTPSGQWARADFTITDGRMSMDDLYELVQQKEGIMLGEYVAIVVITKSAVTEGNLSYTNTSFSVVFDVPEGYVLDGTNLIINESVTTAD